MLTAPSLDEGELDPDMKEGIEQDGKYRGYLAHKGHFYSFLFGQSDPGDVTVYNVNEAGLQLTSKFTTETMTARGTFDNDIVMIKNAWEPAEYTAKWYRYDTDKKQLVGQGELDARELSDTEGERAFFTSIQQVGDKVFAPFWSIESARTFRTSNPDMTHLAIFSYPDMKLEKVLRDSRTGSIGAYFISGIEVDEQGDAYVIGTKLGPDIAGKASTVTPGGFMRIKKGTNEYDKLYFLNVTDASGGKWIYKKLYLGKGNFLLTLGDKHNQYATMSVAYPVRFAVVNVYDGSFKWISGLPDQIVYSSPYSANYSPLDGKTGYVPITGTSSNGQLITTGIYKFDAESATATLGLAFPALDTKVDDATKLNIITSINWLPLNK